MEIIFYSSILLFEVGYDLLYREYPRRPSNFLTVGLINHNEIS